MLIIGLTGGIGSGKTTISNLFENLGIQIIDTDIIARELVEDSPSVLQEIINTFGETILDPGGSLDRKKLAKIVFDRLDKKQQLEKILHPRIRIEVKKKIQHIYAKNTPPPYLIVVIPLLFETDFDDFIDRILSVISDEEIRIKRIIKRDHRDIDEIRSIIKSQATDERRISEADDIIKNNNDIKELEYKVQQLHDKYMTLSKPDR